ncbi:MAG: type II toxin-antitoxin system RatA family toxin [Alphaproteobacteria bacterium]|nr:type II toxin-antitoxin system RatA family toxin [Alphaproteobacteria bacterium]MDE2042225.1 type II toxin-antitoxin system RatA family toxin [Alphaproteobacteria bacterium]MDE2340879.1 type II toxin-antitoxin system RatA family toxin [Alphaproteobacteria bacterium]
MPAHHEMRILPYTPAQMYALVTDVARYGEFLPWVSAVRVRSDSETEMVADLIVGFKALREKFTSRVVKVRPGSVHVDYIEGPLKFLTNDWRFADDGAGGCVVDFSVAFAFRNRIFEALAGQMFDHALKRMIGAFEARADALYGSNNSSATKAA